MVTAKAHNSEIRIGEAIATVAIFHLPRSKLFHVKIGPITHEVGTKAALITMSTFDASPRPEKPTPAIAINAQKLAGRKASKLRTVPAQRVRFVIAIPNPTPG
jgi:hypothetical protein